MLPEITSLGRGTAASSAVRSGSVTSQPPVVVSCSGTVLSQRRLRNSATSTGSSMTSASPSASCICSHSASFPSTGSHSTSCRTRCCWAGWRAAGPELMTVRDAQGGGAGAARTAARVISPPMEWPSRWSGPGDSTAIAADCASTSSASSDCAYADGSAGPGDSCWPRPSTATTRNPASPSGRSNGRKSSLLPMNPGTISTVPARSTPSGGTESRTAKGPRPVSRRRTRVRGGRARLGGRLMGRRVREARRPGLAVVSGPAAVPAPPPHPPSRSPTPPPGPAAARCRPPPPPRAVPSSSRRRGE